MKKNIDNKAFIKIDSGHFCLKFKNGYEISVLNDLGSYCDNYNRHFLISFKDTFISSSDCEIAIKYNDIIVTDKFVNCSKDNVKGFVSSDELADIIYKVKNYK